MFSSKPLPFFRSAAAYALAAGLASLVGAAVGLLLLLVGGFGLVMAVGNPVTQDWRGLTWQSWRRLSARLSLEAGEVKTLQGCALAQCGLRFAPTLPNDAALRSCILTGLLPIRDTTKI